MSTWSQVFDDDRVLEEARDDTEHVHVLALQGVVTDHQNGENHRLVGIDADDISPSALGL